MQALAALTEGHGGGVAAIVPDGPVQLPHSILIGDGVGPAAANTRKEDVTTKPDKRSLKDSADTDKDVSSETAPPQKQSRASSPSTASTATPTEGDQSSSPTAKATRLERPRACYICKGRFWNLHHFYSDLCGPCAALNWKKRNASMFSSILWLCCVGGLWFAFCGFALNCVSAYDRTCQVPI